MANTNGPSQEEIRAAVDNLTADLSRVGFNDPPPPPSYPHPDDLAAAAANLQYYKQNSEWYQYWCQVTYFQRRQLEVKCWVVLGWLRDQNRATWPVGLVTAVDSLIAFLRELSPDGQQ